MKHGGTIEEWLKPGKGSHDASQLPDGPQGKEKTHRPGEDEPHQEELKAAEPLQRVIERLLQKQKRGDERDAREQGGYPLEETLRRPELAPRRLAHVRR